MTTFIITSSKDGVPPQEKAASSPAATGSLGERKVTKSISHRSRIWQHLADDIKPNAFAEVELLLLTFCTGIQDAISFPDYHCFASNQTGNTVFLMLAIILPELNGDMFILENIGMALGMFLAAGWITGQLSHIVGGRNRLWLIVCNLIQTVLVFVAAAIQYRHNIHHSGPAALAAVGLLAFAAGSQVVQSRSLAMTEISTAMATAAWVDLMIDRNMFVAKNRPRTRRIAFIVSLALGALIGAVIHKFAGSPAALVVSASGKLLVTFLFLFNQAEAKAKEAETMSPV